jgi:hypothetical protein
MPPAAIRALVVGVGQYTSPFEPLPNPPNDARAVAALLAAEGADCRLLLNPTQEQLQKGLRDLGSPTRQPEMEPGARAREPAACAGPGQAQFSLRCCGRARPQRARRSIRLQC